MTPASKRPSLAIHYGLRHRIAAPLIGPAGVIAQPRVMVAHSSACDPSMRRPSLQASLATLVFERFVSAMQELARGRSLLYQIAPFSHGASGAFPAQAATSDSIRVHYMAVKSTGRLAMGQCRRQRLVQVVLWTAIFHNGRSGVHVTQSVVWV